VYKLSQSGDDISFKVEKGEILGFLGPNGAGKTSDDEDPDLLHAGHGRNCRVAASMFRRELEVRKRIGYLPRNPPLYPR